MKFEKIHSFLKNDKKIELGFECDVSIFHNNFRQQMLVIVVDKENKDALIEKLEEVEAT